MTMVVDDLLKRNEKQQWGFFTKLRNSKISSVFNTFSVQRRCCDWSCNFGLFEKEKQEQEGYAVVCVCVFVQFAVVEPVSSGLAARICWMPWRGAYSLSMGWWVDCPRSWERKWTVCHVKAFSNERNELERD